MPPKRSAATSKRAPPDDSNAGSSKKAKLENGHTNGSQSTREEPGFVLRQFYPPEMTNERCAEYNNGTIPRPMAQLEATLRETATARNDIDAGDAIVHWFKRDLRVQDNKALKLASKKAKEHNVPLIGVWLLSPEDLEAHLTAPVRVDFELRSLEVLQADLAALNIPLWMEVVPERKNIPQKMIELLRDWSAKHIFTNMEYEVDELRREAKMVRKCLDEGIALDVVHDTCVVPPGKLASGSGKQYAVYTPWYHAWMAFLEKSSEYLDLIESPAANSPDAKEKLSELFDCNVPSAPDNKKLSPEEAKKFKMMWPAGEHEAHTRLDKFAKEKMREYSDSRNFPARAGTACLSVHFAAGTLSARTAVKKAYELNKRKMGGGSAGIGTWISEVAWRDFYKHVLANWPYVCMNKPFKPEYANIEWEYNAEHFEKWCAGKTGFPIVDAAMRQLNHMGYMHNRCRMIVASFLAKDLLLDWRLGERYFMEHLVDGDFASNNGGWGFSASTGVDPQPYFRIFNPLLQSERFDANGDYIREWVPELRKIKGPAIHDPYGRGAAGEASKAGYPEPVVEHKFARDRALERYKAAVKKN